MGIVIGQSFDNPPPPPPPPPPQNGENHPHHPPGPGQDPFHNSPFWNFIKHLPPEGKEIFNMTIKFSRRFKVNCSNDANVLKLSSLFPEWKVPHPANFTAHWPQFTFSPGFVNSSIPFDHHNHEQYKCCKWFHSCYDLIALKAETESNLQKLASNVDSLFSLLKDKKLKKINRMISLGIIVHSNIAQLELEHLNQH